RDQPGLGTVVQVALQPGQDGGRVGGQQGPARLQLGDPGPVGAGLEQRADHYAIEADQQAQEPRPDQQDADRLQHVEPGAGPAGVVDLAEAGRGEPPPDRRGEERQPDGEGDGGDVGGERGHRQRDEAVEQGTPARAVSRTARAQRSRPWSRRTGGGSGQCQPTIRAGQRKARLATRASSSTPTSSGSPTVNSDSTDATAPSRASANAGTAGSRLART